MNLSSRDGGQSAQNEEACLASEHLGAVEAESFDVDQDLAGLRGDDGAALHLQHLRATSFVDHHSLHHLAHGAVTQKLLRPAQAGLSAARGTERVS